MVLRLPWFLRLLFFWGAGLVSLSFPPSPAEHRSPYCISGALLGPWRAELGGGDSVSTVALGSCRLHSEGVTPSPVSLQPPRWTQVTSRSCSKRRQPTSSKSTPMVSLCLALALPLSGLPRVLQGVRVTWGGGQAC